MEKLTDEQKQKIISILEERGANLACPRCGNKHFSILDGYFVQHIQNQFTGMVLGGISVPSAIVVCANCGFLCQHALGTLGLLPEEEK